MGLKCYYLHLFPGIVCLFLGVVLVSTVGLVVVCVHPVEPSEGLVRILSGFCLGIDSCRPSSSLKKLSSRHSENSLCPLNFFHRILERVLEELFQTVPQALINVACT